MLQKSSETCKLFFLITQNLDPHAISVFQEKCASIWKLLDFRHLEAVISHGQLDGFYSAPVGGGKAHMVQSGGVTFVAMVGPGCLFEIQKHTIGVAEYVVPGPGETYVGQQGLVERQVRLKVR